MARVLAISSQVARGHVGLSAIVPALQALGHDVVGLPTVLLSNHPGHAHVAGERVSPELLGRMLETLDRNGWLSEIDTVLTGYLPSVAHVAFAAGAVARLKSANSRCLHLCDPIIGDDPKGIYIEPAAAAAIRDDLVPMADLVKLNAFELAWLTGRAVGSEREAVAAARSLANPACVVTSVPGPGATLSNVLAGADPSLDRALRVPRLPRVPNGTGDLLSALLLGHMLRNGGEIAIGLAHAVAGVAAILSAGQDRDEFHLVAHLHELARCPPVEPSEIA